MSFAEILNELPSLSSDERRLLIERASALEDLELSPEEEGLVEARLADHDREPSTAVAGDEILKRLRSRFA